MDKKGKIKNLWMKNEFLGLISSGEKTLEVRVLFPIFESIKKGDLVSLNEQILIRIKDMRIYSDFEKMLEYEEPSKIWPQHNKSQVLKLLRRLYSSDKEKLGVLVLEIQILEKEL